MTLTPTPGQTVGPFFHYALPYDGDRDLVPPSTPGAIALHGTVYDGAGAPIPDALIEIWQAAPDGTVLQQPGSLRRDGWTFTGFGRASTRRDGTYAFSTLVPGPTEDGAAAFFAVTVFARGLTNRLFTRAYVPGDEAALAADRLLASVEEDRRSTLLAVADAYGLRFDIRLQGEDETVFLRFPGH
ncbi:protocatechuate 3,4-dioxygenase subunit alpha [Mumia zhuanghuii]|uniref:Protocatechuate 3,4-dioxygenase subunit alpha n=2 Tax=Mumia TaxID=1546255 RepID=A0ABW1QNY0_9ACTN|nr:MULTISPECIES: protocatechuate 3,4-dioxygenase subunit alpha [Mumia]KAA1424947.1 protocatechuate 3,4-dioxygenase subunit alpha [Mumia zhuanghuii]